MDNRHRSLAAQMKRFNACAPRTSVLINCLGRRFFGPVVNWRRAAARRQLTTGPWAGLLSITIPQLRSAEFGAGQQTSPSQAGAGVAPDQRQPLYRLHGLAHR